MNMFMVDYKNFTNESGIYCFKNKVNGKCYIGQSINLKHRLTSHLNSYKNPKKFRYAIYKAIIKYGIDNFDISIIEFVDPNTENIKSVLDSLEKKYIEEYNSLIPNGYNMTKGGDAGVLGLKMTDEQKELIRQNALKSAEKYKKYVYAYDMKSNTQYDKITYSEASKLSKVCAPNISKICAGKYYHPYCKDWVFAMDPKSLQEGIKTYLSDIEKYGPTEKRNSGRFIKNDPRFEIMKSQFKRGHKKGFVMSEEQKLKISNSNPRKRAIDQLDINGNLIKVFSSLSQINKELNFCISCVIDVCKRKTKKNSYKGFIWRYHDDDEYIK